MSAKASSVFTEEYDDDDDDDDDNDSDLVWDISSFWFQGCIVNCYFEVYFMKT